MAKHGTRGLFSVLSFGGLVAGLVAWALVEVLPGRGLDARLLLAMSAAAIAFFTGALLSMGPLRIGAALLTGLILALPTTALLWGASLHFGPVDTFLDSGHASLAFCLLAGLSLPFVIGFFRFDQDPTNYTALHENAWGLVTRSIAAIAFVTLFWGAIHLSNGLLGLVEIHWIDRALEVEPVPYALTGLALGMALAAAHRMATVIGPNVLIQLLRLLLPIETVVTAVFLGALALRGMAGFDLFFGRFSPAATMTAMGYAATLLIAAAVERGGLRAVQSRVMRAVVAALAVMLPALGLLSALAIRARVGQYGWTPDRLAAACAAAILCGYGATHAVAVLARRNWMQRIRQGNVLMAAVVIVIAALWLNPVFSPYDIAARSLAARLGRSPETVTDRDLRMLAHDYGRAGQEVLDRLARETDEALQRRIAAARSDVAPEVEKFARSDVLDALRRDLALRPEGAGFPEPVLEAMSDGLLLTIGAGCDRRTPAGAPGCAAIVADMLPAAEGDEVLILYIASDGRLVVLGRAANGATALRLHDVGGEGLRDPGLVDAALAGDLDFGPPPVTAVALGNRVLFPLP